MTTDLSEETIAEAERLTRLERRAVDERERDAYRARREELLEEYGYLSRIREDGDDPGSTLVLYPTEWVDAEGIVRTDRIDDTDRAVEVSLSGPGDPEVWDAIDAHNRSIAASVREEHGDVYGDNVAAFADFMSNHCAKRVEAANAAEIEEFLSEYYPRNAWPSDAQKSVIVESIRFAMETVGAGTPPRA
jgi:hypothetical protein